MIIFYEYLSSPYCHIEDDEDTPGEAGISTSKRFGYQGVFRSTPSEIVFALREGPESPQRVEFIATPAPDVNLGKLARLGDLLNECNGGTGAKHPFMIGLAPDGTSGAAGMNITTPEDMLRYAMIYTPSWNKVAKEKIVSDKQMKCIQTLGNPEAYRGSGEEAYGKRWFGETPYMNTAQWDHSFEDGAMFKHGNMGQGIYVDPARDFCGQYFGLATNDEAISGADHSPGYLRAAAKLLAGK